ncbi:MAG: branched-chain amino acid aminotransferase, partial [Lachnospiraceae bacterium]|nr:branched-chain amino acid aminotransferase [Lachnospiraceae bacterium]
KKGLNCCIASWRRISDENLSPRIKCGANYMNSRAGQREALRNGYDTCLFLNDAGTVSEGPGACLFMVRKGVLATPRLTDSILESITRDTVLKLAEAEGIETQERAIDRTELYACQEAFLCGSAMEITPVWSIDGHAVGAGSTGRAGRITEALQRSYAEAACGRREEWKDWATGIYGKA